MPSSPLPTTPEHAAATPPSPLRRRLRGWLEGVVFFALLLAIVLATAATGRVGIATYRRPLTDSLWRWYPAALWRDLAAGVPYLAVLAGTLLALVLLCHALFRRGSQTQGPRRWLQGILFFVGLVTWLSAISFCESLIQRGSLPVWHDFMGGMDEDFLASALRNFTYARYLVPAAIVWLLIGWGISRFGWWITQSPWRPWGFAGGFAAASVAFVVLTHPIHAPLLPVPGVLLRTPGVNDPFGRFFGSVAMVLRGAPTEPRRILEGAELGPPTADGAALLGLPFAAATEDCAKHPWAVPFEARASAFSPLSGALFDPAGAALDNLMVFQISLESFRGDDLTALNPNAPRVLAPFINGLIEAAGRDSSQQGPAVIAPKNMWQGGVRTSQGISAFSCGLGALPHGISLVRDIGPVPLRCVSDVLVDAGFEGVFAYGSNPSFDNMKLFFAYHGFTVWLNEDTLPKGLPLGEWGAVADRALVQQTMARLASAPPHPTFTLLMTLSNHSPFKPPQDLPGVIDDRVKQALASRPNRAKQEDRPRLMTYAYTDYAVEEFFTQLHQSGLAERSIVILHADHATGERFIWDRADGQDPMTEQAKTRIPLAIVLPAPLVAKTADPARVRALAAAVHGQLNTGPTSLNDVPTWLLGLLGRHPAVAKLPEAWRWHTLGGMTASPAFAARSVPAARLWGINGINQLFFLDARGGIIGQLEDIVTLTVPEELFTTTRPLFAASALWSDFLRGYARRCPSARWVRLRQP